MKQVDPETVRALEARGFEQRNEWHWRKKLEVGAIDIWPTTGKLRWVGKMWIGGLDAVDKILATNGQRVPPDLKEPAPQAVNSEAEGVWITIGALCPWNPTPGIRRLFHFDTESAAQEARMAGFVGIEDAGQEPEAEDVCAMPNSSGENDGQENQSGPAAVKRGSVHPALPG